MARFSFFYLFCLYFGYSKEVSVTGLGKYGHITEALGAGFRHSLSLVGLVIGFLGIIIISGRGSGLNHEI